MPALPVRPVKSPCHGSGKGYKKQFVRQALAQKGSAGRSPTTAFTMVAPSSSK